MIDMEFKQTHDLFGHQILKDVVYVDAIIVTRYDENEQLTLRQCLTKGFEIKKLGKLKSFGN